jgi:hypothetical protein
VASKAKPSLFGNEDAALPAASEVKSSPAPKKAAPSLFDADEPAESIFASTSTPKKKEVASSTKPKDSGSLFGEPSESLFDSTPSSKPVAAPALSLFGESSTPDEPKKEVEKTKKLPAGAVAMPGMGELGIKKEKEVDKPQKKEKENPAEKVDSSSSVAKKSSLSLFDADEEPDSIFAAAPPKKVPTKAGGGLFAEESEPVAAKAKTPSLFEAGSSSTSSSLFGESTKSSGSSSLFGGSSDVKIITKGTESKLKSPPVAAFASAPDEDPLGMVDSAPQKPAAKPAPTVSVEKEVSLFGHSTEEPAEPKANTSTGRERASSKVLALQGKLALNPLAMLGTAPPKVKKSASSTDDDSAVASSSVSGKSIQQCVLTWTRWQGGSRRKRGVKWHLEVSHTLSTNHQRKKASIKTQESKCR